jgi:tRNA pseudouridine38-40 synthase
LTTDSQTFNYKLILEYDGSKFYGWQVQPGMRTVQGEVENALQILFRESIRVNVAGRTDAGVHALGQVINFRSAVELPLAGVPRSLNGILSHDVVVKKIELAPADFHARYDAKSRQYFYVLSKFPVAVGRHYAFFCKFPLDLAAMREASQYLLGEHDFRAFCDASTEDSHYLSRMELIEWEETEERIKLIIRANRFLRSMVRIIVGTMIDVGRGKLAPAQVKDILDSRRRSEASFTAPPHGLFLEKVFY